MWDAYMNQEQAETGAAIVGKLSPPVAVLSAKFAGMNISDMVLWLTLIYTVLLVVHKLWRMGLEAHRFWFQKRADPVDDDA